MSQKRFPAFKEAVQRIVEIFDAKGYGVIISDAEIDEFLSITVPEGKMTYEEFQKVSMERLQRYRAIENLLSEHNICLVRSKAVAGFELLPPKEQVTVAYEKRMAKVRRELNKAAMALSHVNHTLLSMDEETDRQKKMMRSAFVRCALNKRTIELVRPPEKKKISE